MRQARIIHNTLELIYSITMHDAIGMHLLTRLEMICSFHGVTAVLRSHDNK